MKHAVPLLLACTMLSGVAAAQSYPAKMIRLVVPFAPGGPNDNIARIVGQKLTELWGQTVVVENRGGAGGTIGMEFVAKLPADGHALAMGGSSNMAVAPSLYRKLAYDPVRDFTPIINVAQVPYALAVNPRVPAKTAKDVIAIAARKAGYLSYGSSGSGSMSSLAAELFKSMSNTDIVHVPYKGTAPALTDVVAGQIDMMFADVAVVQPQSSVGKLKMLGVTSSKRLASLPDLPAITESGLKGYAIEPWFGIVGPAHMPREVVAKLNGAIAGLLKSPDVAQRFGALHYEPVGGAPERFAATVRADIAHYAKIVKSAGITPE